MFKFPKLTKVIFLILAVILFFAFSFGEYAKVILPILAVVAGVGLIIWKIPQERLQKVLGLGFVKQITLGLVVTVIFLGLLWLIYGYAARQIVGLLGVEYRTAYLIVTILGLPLIVAFWHIYQNAGIPGSPQTIAKGIKIMVVIGILFLGYWYYKQPDRFFDANTGEAVFYIDDSTGKIYYHSGYSPETGERLRRGTQKDLKKIKKDFQVDLSAFSAGLSKTQNRKQMFSLQAGEEKRTVFVSKGIIYRIKANKNFYAFSVNGPYLMKAGYSSWVGDYPEGLLRIRGIYDNTIIIFERIR